MSGRRRSLYLCACAVLVLVIGVAAWNVAAILLEYRAGEQTYARISELSRLPAHSAPPEAQESAEALSARNFAALEEAIPDVVAWISIPGTNIDYPVVQGADNSYYLTHLATGEENSAGSIFLDYRAASDFSQPYSIIYGHNLRSGTMFTGLNQYKKQDFYEEHPLGVLETPGGDYEIAFFSGFVACKDHEVWDTDMATNDFSAWAERMVEQSWFRAARFPVETDRILTLSTCTYEFDNARFVLLGILR
ncbi:class B sortase [uncultured Flavonifractor sp.]|uniref:class B sortase n=1 Tax=uncultured Flavonifractor sp. TaxID=1193534 RepID=UPI002625E104|nr:class B sortase [uncultured Flavonifractor sp.]